MKRIVGVLPHAALLVLLALLSFPLVLPLLEPRDSGHELHAQDVYTDLTDPAQIRVFTEVSDGLICQCGCHFVLSSCPHVECPWGIPVRRFMEIKIQEGMSAAEILEKMETGFGPEIRSYPLVQQYLEQGREDIVKGLESGWGPGVSAHASPFGLVAVLLLSGVIAVYLFSYWWKRNRKSSGGTNGDASSPESKNAGTNNSPDTELESRIQDLDR